jgi:hypothetical protein
MVGFWLVSKASQFWACATGPLRALKEHLQELKTLRRERWVPMKDKLERIVDPTLTGRAQYDALIAVRNDLESLRGEIATAKGLAEQDISNMIEDVQERASNLEQRATKAHAVWRDVLDLNRQLQGLQEAAAAVREAKGTDQIDRYSAVRDAHATFEGRWRGLHRLFEPGATAAEREKLAALGLGRAFIEVKVQYSESAS